MQKPTKLLLTAATLFCLIPAAGQAVLSEYSQDFELLALDDPSALANDGWWVFGNVFDPQGEFLYDYGRFPAPNHPLAFCAIVVGEGGAEQGIQQLVVFNDYENGDHAFGNLIESNVYQEQTITAEDVGQAWVFEFQAKRGNIEGASTAAAFIKTLDPNAGFFVTNFITADMTSIPTTWTGATLGISIDSGLVGQILQFGFVNVATNYEGSGIYYDNLVFRQLTVDVPDASVTAGPALRQNYPNPFNPSTSIGFSLERSENVEISVFDLAGRRIATVHQGALGAGEHQVVWNGRTDRGNAAPAGQYRYVLRTDSGQKSRSMVLVK
jgi:hypothetical protein